MHENTKKNQTNMNETYARDKTDVCNKKANDSSLFDDEAAEPVVFFFAN